MNRKSLNTRFYTDHILAKTKYSKGNPGEWIYKTGNTTVAYPSTKHSEVGDMPRQFADNVEIPDRLRSDLAPEIIGNYIWFKAQLKLLHIDLTHF